MDMRLGVLVLLMLGGGWVSAAPQMAAMDVSLTSPVISHIQALAMKSQGQLQQVQISDAVVKNGQLCTLCEEFAAEALDYLTENETQSEIIDILHQLCALTGSFKQQCISLVDYYASLFFLEISSIEPEAFCQKINLCEYIVSMFLQAQEDGCSFCRRAISEVLVKLKDPDTQLEIIELLLKACNSMQDNAAKCKKLVIEYGPLVLANAEKFLESTDICTMLHACSLTGTTKLAADS